MAEAMDLILEYLAFKDLISSLFLSRILPLVPYDTIIQPLAIPSYPTYPYPYRDLSLSLRRSLALSPLISRSVSIDLSLCLRRSLALSPLISCSLFEVISHSVSIDLWLCLRRSLALFCLRQSLALSLSISLTLSVSLVGLIAASQRGRSPLCRTSPTHCRTIARRCWVPKNECACLKVRISFVSFMGFFFFLNKGKYL